MGFRESTIRASALTRGEYITPDLKVNFVAEI